MLKQYPAALKYITEVIERGIKEHPGEDKIEIMKFMFACRIAVNIVYSVTSF